MKTLPLEKLAESVENLNQKVESFLDTERPLRADQAAEFLQISKKTLQNYVSKKVIPHHKSSIGVYFYPSELNKLIKNKSERY